MKWLILFSVAFLGLVSCENDVCLTTNLRACMQGKAGTLGEDASKPCSMVGAVKECIQNAEKACKVNEDPNLKDLFYVIEDVCTEGSEKHKKFMENFPCFANSFDTSKSCVASILKDVTPEAVQDVEKMKEITKTVCKQMDSIVKCFEKNVEDACKKNVKDFFKDLYSP
ncbi:hypothetical protein X975_24436, partial [Stegodyphus mimosarum]